MQGSECTEVESWRSELIAKIARRKGFRAHELDDARQQISLEILSYRFDPLKSNGASERRIVSLLIEKKLTHLQRTAARRRKHQEKVRRVCGPSKYEPRVDDAHLQHQRRFELCIDIQAAVSGMSPVEQQVCQALSAGDSCLQIAKRLDITRHQLRQVIHGIRERLSVSGLDSL